MQYQQQQRQALLLSSEGLLKHMAMPMITQMGLLDPAAPSMQVLDNACGTAVLTQELQRLLPKEVIEKSSFVCADNAQGAVDLVVSRVKTERWINTDVKQLDAMVSRPGRHREDELADVR